MNGLSEIATLLQDMRPDMKRMADAVTVTTLRDVTRYITTADLRSCKQIVDALIERVFDLSGNTDDLQDASVSLQEDIEYEQLPEEAKTWPY